MNSEYLQLTPLLDFDSAAIQELIDSRGWRNLEEAERIRAIYDFCRDEIGLGYNADDAITASAVLADGYGQCNTKSILLMALLRATGTPCRLHGATVAKKLQKGIVDGVLYRIAPESIVHTWAEVYFDGAWSGLEGVVVDRRFIDGIRREVSAGTGPFIGYAIGTEDIERPNIEWSGSDTSIQATGIDHDYGVFDDPDAFYRQVGSNLSGPKKLLYRYGIRHLMNRKVAQVRACGSAESTCTLDRPEPRSVEPAGVR
jgi:hypothetical protein